MLPVRPGLALLVALATPAWAQTPPSPEPAAPAAQPLPEGPERPELPATESFDAKLSAQLGQPGGLTADETARRATATSLEVRGREAELEAAEAGVSQALASFLPRVSVTAGYTRQSAIAPQAFGTLVASPGSAAGPLPPGAPLENVALAIPTLQNQTTVRAALTVPVSDYLLRLSRNYASANASEAAARHTTQATQLKVAADARILYYSWIRAALQSTVAEASLAQARDHLADAHRAFAVGGASRADVLRVEAQVASAELLVARTANLRNLQAERLRTALHEPRAADFAIGEDVREALPPLDGLSSPAELVEEARGHRLELRAVQEATSAARSQAQGTRAGYLPRLDAVGDVIYANPNPRYFPPTPEFNTTWSAGVQLSWTPTDILTTRGASRAANARVAQLEAQRAALEDGLQVEVVQALNDLREAELASQTTQRGLSSSEEAYRVRRLLFQNGRATSTELTDAEADLTRARFDAVNARIDLRLARVKLLHALGRDVQPS
ncbi:TolC family protein [Stigmatella erecta]|uniref:Outer membrane protein TolC n=1 Tax=Stigmatella erecta TaxID=83460 RepID=A0A1I0L981_9BACT|nr:TolC family protein [Stigmatella erecta]SEU36622.1 Outer membrane protein TolC [Stigmatella erecta]